MLRLVAALFVVFIHFPMPGAPGKAVEAVARFAVPFFFVIAGYFAPRPGRTDLPAAFRKRGWDLTKLLLWAVPLFVAWLTFRHYYQAPEGPKAPWQLINADSLFRLIFVNDTGHVIGPGADHLWFLPALLYCHGLYYLMVRWSVSSSRSIFPLAAGLLGLNIVLGEFSQAYGTDLSTYVLRNWLVTALPCYLLGVLIRSSSRTGGAALPSLRASMGLCAIGAVSSVLERAGAGLSDLYVGSVLLAVGLLLVALNAPVFDGSTVEFLSRQGTRLSGSIYILHPMIGSAFIMFWPQVRLWSVPLSRYLFPVIVFAVTAIVVAVAKGVKDSLLTRLRPRAASVGTS